MNIDSERVKQIFAERIFATRDDILDAKSLKEIDALKSALKMYETTLGMLDSEFSTDFASINRLKSKPLYDIVIRPEQDPQDALQ